MRTLTEYYNDFITAADFGTIEVNYHEERDSHVARVRIDGREFFLGLNYMESRGIYMVIVDGLDNMGFWEDELDEDGAFALQFIYNYIAA